MRRSPAEPQSISQVTHAVDIEVSGTQLRVSRIDADAQRPTIVFLHDSLGCIAVWRDFPAQLCAATNCNGLIYDRQGYGESAPFSGQPRDLDYLEREADVLGELIRLVAPQKTILYGHSDGGSIALIAAAQYPDLIGAVLAEGAHMFVEELSLQGIRHAQKVYLRLLPRLRKYHGDKSEAVFSAWADTWLSPAFRAFNMEHFLPLIKCPVMVLQGANDEYGTEAQVDSVVNQVPGGARKLMVPKVGHTPHKDALEPTLAACAEFIRQVAG